MRELKFRQFVNGRWHYWGNLGDITSFVGPVTPKVESFQYTGLKDRSGHDIFEGDIYEGWHVRRRHIWPLEALGAAWTFDKRW